MAKQIVVVGPGEVIDRNSGEVAKIALPNESGGKVQPGEAGYEKAAQQHAPGGAVFEQKEDGSYEKIK